MLSLASSRFTLPVQFIFIAANAFGVLLVTVYNAQTPDPYPGNAHHSLGWIITLLCSAHAMVSLIGRLACVVKSCRRDSLPAEEHEHAIMPVVVDTDHQFQTQRLMGRSRPCDDSGESSEQRNDSLRSNSGSTHVGDDGAVPGYHKENKDDEDDQSPREMPFTSPKPMGAWTHIISKVATGRLGRYFDVWYKVVG